MNCLKNNKGITLVALAIVVVVLLILVGTVTHAGINNIEKAENNLLLAELEQVKHFVGETYYNYLRTHSEALLIGTPVADNTVSGYITPQTLVSIPSEYYENGVKKAIAKFYQLSPTDLEKIGVENCRNTYIVNYLTGETYNMTKGTTSAGELLYTYSRNSFTSSNLTGFDAAYINDI